MDILKNLTLEEIERQRYEQREKARRDALSWEKALEDAEQRARQAEQRAQQRAAEGLIGQIRLCERFLKRTPMPEEQLQAMSVDQLEQLADQLKSQLPD